MSLEHDLIGRQARIRRSTDGVETMGEIIALDTCYGEDQVHIWVSTMDLGVVRVRLEQQSIVLPGGWVDADQDPTTYWATLDERTGELMADPQGGVLVVDYGQVPTEEDTQKDPVPTGSKWDYAPTGCDWFARDEDDCACFYQGDKPQQEDEGWWPHPDSDRSVKYYTGPKDLIKWDIPWRESLEARPGSAAERILRGEDLHQEAAAQPSKWDYAPEGYDWFARDKNGTLGFFAGGIPRKIENAWWSNEHSSDCLEYYTGPEDLIHWDIPWDESLEARPGSAAAMQWAGEMLMEAAASLNKDPRKRGLQAQMLAYLQEHKYLIFTAEKLWAMDQFRAWEIPTISKALAKLCSAGHLERVRRGWYRAI